MKLFCCALVFACLLIPVGTSTRTGLLCIGLLAVLMLRDAKRKLLYLGLIAALGAGRGAVPARSRSPTGCRRSRPTRRTNPPRRALAVWKWTWEYVKQHPLGGGFEMYRQNQIRYDTVKVGRRRRQRHARHDS